MSSVRNQRLHELVDKALDNTISTLGGAKEFGRCFAVDRDAQDCLEACYDDAIASFRTNAKAEIRTTLYETKLSDDLHRLDAFIAQQPQLNDGSRCLPPARVDPAKAVAAVAAEQRIVHKRKLESLLRALEAENALIRSTVAESRAHIDSASTRVNSLYDPSAPQSCC